MSRVCTKCGKHPSGGHTVSHSNRKTNRRFLPNLVEKSVYDSVKKSFSTGRICTRCLRTMRKSKV
ncbi:TPA: 50S ribosomal protein L28 [Candidatus Peregrinibacteria bacterium]|nr:50S ribosomal protein L28 [Candidatus Peregrinibacteria bacterium]